MEVSWYCWVTVMSLVTNFHGCLCWPTLQPPLKPVTSKHELDSDESRKVLGSSVVTSVSVIMDHGNGTKTFLTDENPELKTNAIASPGNLLNPDRYEFYTFDETGDLVKRLMTWDEIQGLIAGGDGDSLLGEASVPMYYSDLPDKVSPTHLTANDFQTSDIQGVHKVVESVQNVLKSELAASQSKIPPVSKPELLSNAPNWSLFLPTLLDNAEDGSELSNLGILASPPTAASTKTTQTTSSSLESTVNTTEATKVSSSEATSTTMKEFVKKTEKPNRFKVTTSKPSMPSKTPFNPPTKTSSSSSSSSASTAWPSSYSSFMSKKPYSTSKYGLPSSNDDRWTSTPATTSKKTFTSSKYGGYVSSDDHYTPTSSPVRRNSTTKYGGYSSFNSTSKYGGYSSFNSTSKYGGYSSLKESPPTTESTVSSTQKTYTTSKYGSQSTNNELFSSIASVLQQVTDDTKFPTSASFLNSTSTLQYKTPTESTPMANANTFDKIISMSQFKTTVEPTKHSSHSPSTDKFAFHHRPSSDFTRSTTESLFKTASSTENRYTEYSKLPSLQNKYTPYQYKPTTDFNKYSTSERTSPFSSFSSYRPGYPPFSSHKPASTFSDSHKTTSTLADSHQPSSSFLEIQKPQPSSSTTTFTPVQFRSTSTESTKYTLGTSSVVSASISELLRPSSSSGSSSSSSSSSTSFNSTVRSPEGNRDRYNLTGEHLSSSSALTSLKDMIKTTKIYESSTMSSTYTPASSYKYTYATKPTKNKISYTKYSPKPESTSTSHKTSTTSEKPLIRISTLRPTVVDQTTTKPEPLVTWLSTSPLEETPSKVSLFGVFDSDKLVTEQYVSSSNERHPPVAEFFRNTTAVSPTTTSTLSTVTREPPTVSVLTELYTDLRQNIKQTLKPFSSSSFTRFPSTSIKNSLSSISEITRPTRPSERPEISEAKTEPSSHHSFSFTNKYSPSTFESTADKFKSTTKVSGPTLQYVSDKYKSSTKVSTPTVTLESTPDKFKSSTRVTAPTFASSTADKFKSTTKVSPPVAPVNHSETVMQRIPTLNPPHRPTSSTSGSKATTRPQYLFTEAMKNITQIAVMLNRANDTSISKQPPAKNEYRNKVTHPTFDTTRPLNAVFINDCITSLLSGAGTLKDNNYTTESATAEHSHIHYYKLPATDQKENSLIYFYKLSPVTAAQDTTQPSKPTESLSSVDPEIQFYSPELSAEQNSSSSSTKTTSSLSSLSSAASEEVSEYQKLTTAAAQQHPTSVEDVLQEGISAVTNVLLQTESRVPNKEFTEFDTLLNSSGGSRVSSPATESIMRTDEIELSTPKNTTRTSQPIVVVDELTTVRITAAAPSSWTTPTKPENRTHLTSTTQSFSYSPSTVADNATEAIESTSLEGDVTDRANNFTDSVDITTTEMAPVTDNVEVASSVASTVSSDFRNELLDDRNATQDDEEETSKSHSVSTVSITPTNRTTPALTTQAITSTVKFTQTTEKLLTSSTPKPTTTVTKADTPAKTQPTTTTTSTTTTTTTTTNNRSNVSTSASTPALEYVEVKLENKTKPSSQEDDSPPPSAFRSPSPAQYKPLSSTAGPNVELHPAPHESMGLEASIAYLGDDVKRFVDFCNELSFKIWTTQTGKNLMNSRSIVLSPFAVLSALAMIFLGARGSSSGIMNDFLKLDDMVTFNPHQVFQNITESATNPKNIGVANTALVREIFSDKSKGKVLEFYKERLQQYYDTHVEEINFNSIGDLIRRRTNLLVKRQTVGRIPDYLKGSALVMKPPLAILTANVFQTDCDLASTEGRDGEMYFVVRPSARQRRLVPIPAVVYRSGFLAGYEPGLDATAVTLNPESTVSTILVLPGQQGQVAPGDGLARLEQRLLESSYRRGAWSRLLRSLLFRPGLELQIPRFSHKSVLNLTAGLQKMGLEEIFAPDQADLRGINGLQNELHLSDIVQVNTFSTCGEHTVGARHHTETYPTSSQRVARMSDIFDRSYLDDSVNNYYSSLPLNLRPRQARLPDNPRLRFDRPFLYIVRHNPTGMILYIGRFNPRLLP